jgi:hypothetical protein
MAEVYPIIRRAMNLTRKLCTIIMLQGDRCSHWLKVSETVKAQHQLDYYPSSPNTRTAPFAFALSLVLIEMVIRLIFPRNRLPESTADQVLAED